MNEKSELTYIHVVELRTFVPINDVVIFHLNHPGHVNVSTMGHEADCPALCCHSHTAGSPNSMDVVSQSVRKVVKNYLCHLQQQRTREFLL